MMDALFRIASQKPALKDQALERYIPLVSKSSLQSGRKLQLYQQALNLNPSVKVQKQTLKALAGIRKYPSLMLVSKYLNRSETAA